VSDPLGGLEPAREPEPQRVERRSRPFAPTTWALLILIGIGFAAEWFVGGDPAVESQVALIRLGALYLPAIRDGDWWRLGSYAFLHIGWAHVAMNAWSLWILGPQLEATYGSNLTLGFFSGTAIAGGAASALWAMLRSGHPALAAGASGGLFGLFGATAALAFRVRHRMPPEARRSIYRRIAFNLVLNAAIAISFPVDSAAHLGGLLFGTVLGLVAPLPSFPVRAWHRPAHWLIVGFALALACMEGAAVAWAVRPKPRTLRSPGLEAKVSGLLMPVEPGVALLPGAAYVEIRRDDEPLRIVPGESAVRIGDRTWLRQEESREGTDTTLLAAADGGGRLVIEFGCGADFCKGAKGARIYEQVARTVRTVP
jgi:membrane associated rhomboid family serine protease